jgi:hypothetical protein
MNWGKYYTLHWRRRKDEDLLMAGDGEEINSMVMKAFQRRGKIENRRGFARNRNVESPAEIGNSVLRSSARSSSGNPPQKTTHEPVPSIIQG